MSRCAIAAIMAGAMVGWPSAVSAQNNQSGAPATDDGNLDDGLPEEIMVTARKRSEALINVPVAVTALSAEDIDRYGATDLAKFAQMAPQVIAEKAGGGGSGAVFVVRGIGSSTTDAGLSSTVSVNIDGTQVSRGRIITQGFFDLEQVEILKGPQALFFGKNSPAGVISLRSKGATRSFEGYVRAGYDFEAKERFAEGAISGPITDTLGFRVAVRGSQLSGWVRNTGRGFTLASDPLFPNPDPNDRKFPGTRELLGRVTLDWRPTDRFQAVFKVFAGRNRDDGPYSYQELKCTNPNGFGITTISGTTYVNPNADCRVDGRNSRAVLNPARATNFLGAPDDGEPYSKYKSVLSSLNMSYELDDVTFTSVTSYYKTRTEFFDSIDPAGVGQFAHNKITSRDFAQEVRAQTTFDGPLNVMVGGYYEYERNPFLGAVSIFSTIPDPVTGQTEDWILEYDSHGRTYSAFGQVNYDILDNLELSVGARYTREARFLAGSFTYLKPGLSTIVFGPAGRILSGSQKNNNVSPEATLTYHPTDRSTLYISYKTGFKSGGFSQASTLPRTYTIDTLRFAPEKVRGFEIGAKGKFFDNRLRVTAAAYRYKFNNLQVQTFDPPTVSFQIKNSAATRTTGAEVDATFQLSKALQLRGAAAYNEAKFVNYRNGPCYGGQPTQLVPVGGSAPPGVCGETSAGVRQQDLSGRHLARAPRWNLSGGASYEVPLTGDLNLGLTGDFRYSSSYYAQENFNPLSYQKSFAIFNASVRVFEASDRWELALLGKNLTNKRYIIASIDKSFGPAGQVSVSIPRTREITLQGTMRF